MLTYSLGRNTVSYWKQVMAMDAWPTAYILSAVWKQRSMLVRISLPPSSSMRGPHEMILSTFRLDFAFSVKSLWRHPHRCIFQWFQSQASWQGGWILTETLNKLKHCYWSPTQQTETLLLKSYSANWNIVAESLLDKLKHCYWILIRQTETLLLNSYSANWNIIAESLVLASCVYSCHTLVPQVVTVSSALQAFVVCLLSFHFSLVYSPRTAGTFFFCVHIYVPSS